MTTNEIRRTRIKYEISKMDNINWFLEDFVKEFKSAMENHIEFPNSLLENNTIVEEVKKKLRLKYLDTLSQSDREQLQFQFYGEG